jgi:hypothetical protein
MTTAIIQANYLLGIYTHTESNVQVATFLGGSDALDMEGSKRTRQGGGSRRRVCVGRWGGTAVAGRRGGLLDVGAALDCEGGASLDSEGGAGRWG